MEGDSANKKTSTKTCRLGVYVEVKFFNQPSTIAGLFRIFEVRFRRGLPLSALC